MWHCPSCGAPQAESARCWVCHRSSTTCSTCRHFRTSLSADVGWCALDPRRRPLTGLEQRGCWQEGAVATESAPLVVAARQRDRAPVGAEGRADRLAPVHRDFVPVELLGPISSPRAPEPPAAPSDVLPPAPIAPVLAELEEGWAERTSLFGEPEA